MESFDLNLDNYELKDLLTLFKIPENFNEEDLKVAKKMVLMTHPDKCKLDAKYFRFYSQAYKQLFFIWEFKTKKTNVDKSFQIDKETKTIHSTDHSLEKEQKKALDRILKKNPENFNQWFNEQFEKTRFKTEEEEGGYGNWLTSNEDVDDQLPPGQVKSVADMAKEMDRKKEKMRSLILYQEIEDLYATGVNASQLVGEAPSSYSSELFSSLPYEYLRKAHTETVIPVTMEDFHNKKKFTSVDEYKQARSMQDISTQVLSDQQSREYLRNRENLQGKEATERAYKLAKQSEEVDKKNKEFWSRILHIER